MVTLFKLLRNTIVRFLSQLFILIGMSDVVERLSWAGFPPVVFNVHLISADSHGLSTMADVPCVTTTRGKY